MPESGEKLEIRDGQSFVPEALPAYSDVDKTVDAISATTFGKIKSLTEESNTPVTAIDPAKIHQFELAIGNMYGHSRTPQYLEEMIRMMNLEVPDKKAAKITAYQVCRGLLVERMSEFGIIKVEQGIHKHFINADVDFMLNFLKILEAIKTCFEDIMPSSDWDYFARRCVGELAKNFYTIPEEKGYNHPVWEAGKIDTGRRKD